MDIQVVGERLLRQVPEHKKEERFKLLTFYEVTQLTLKEQRNYEITSSLYLEGKL
jgi:hypothetical protein